MWLLTKTTISLSKGINTHESLTSIGKTKFVEAENDHEFELRTMTEKLTKTNQANVL
jgi:hypothetical protein